MYIVELVGPAGSGKSTITKALGEKDSRIQIGAIPNVRDIKNLPFFLWSGSLSLSAFLALHQAKYKSCLTAEQVAIMALLRGWPRRLHTASLKNQNIILIDQGPIYMLAELLRYGPAGFQNTISNWWECVCTDWANVLNMVICLDTSDEVLMERVRTRDIRHGIKSHSDQWAEQFLAQSRAAQSNVLKAITEKHRNMKVLQIDTSHVLLHETVERIRTTLEPYRNTTS